MRGMTSRGKTPAPAVGPGDAEAKDEHDRPVGVVALYIGDCARLFHAQAVDLLRRVPMLRTLCLESVVGGPLGPCPVAEGAEPSDGRLVGDATLLQLAVLCPHVTAAAVRWGHAEAERGTGRVRDRWCVVVTLMYSTVL